LIPLASRSLDIGKEKKVWLSLAIFGAAIAIGVIGWFPLTVTFIGAVIVYVMIGILPVREMYDNVDWPVIVLLGAMIPVGRGCAGTGSGRDDVSVGHY